MEDQANISPVPPDPPLAERLAQLETRVADLEKEGAALRSELTASRAALHPPPPSRSVPTQGIVPPADPRVWPPPPSSPAAGQGGSSVGLLVGGPSPTTRPVAKPAIEFTTEMAMKWAGLVLLFLAAAFMVSTAISRGWIGPQLQLAGAVVGGLALIAGGLKLRHREGWGESLVFVGLAVLFVCAGASWEWLGLGSAGLAAVMAVLVGVLAIGLARYMSAWTLGLVALFGLIIDPIWLDIDSKVGLGFSLLYLLSILLVMTVLYLDQQWAALWVLTVLASAVIAMLMVLDGAWGLDDRLTMSRMTEVTTVGLLAGLLVVYWLAPVVSATLTNKLEVSVKSEVASLAGMEYRIVLLAPAWFWFCVREFTSMERDGTIVMGLILVALAAVSTFLTRWKVLKAFFATQCVATSIVLAIILAVAFDGPVLLAAFGVQAALLVALIRDLDDVWFTLQALFAGAMTLLVTTGRMLEALVDDASWSDDMAHLLIVALIAVVGLLELRRSHSSGTSTNMSDDMESLEARTSREWADTMGQLTVLVAYVGLLAWVATVFGHLAQGQGQVSAIWSILAAGLVAIALVRRSNKLLQVGLATFGLVVAKLLTVDLAAVDTFWRVGLFFVIGSGLLVLSYQLPRLMGAAQQSPVRVPTDESDPADTRVGSDRPTTEPDSSVESEG